MSRRAALVAAVLVLGILAAYSLWGRPNAAARTSRVWHPDDAARLPDEGHAASGESTSSGPPAASAPTAHDANRGGLRVTVEDGNGQPRRGSQVKVLLSSYPALAWSEPRTTGESGTAEFADIAAGRVVVYASVGSLDRCLAADVNAGAVTDVRIPVPRGVQVEGHVRHVEKGPLAGLTLHFQRNDGTLFDAMETTTDAAGLYRLTNAAPGRYLVSIRPGPGHAYLDVPAVDTAEQDLVFGVLSVAGTVRDAATGQPLADVTLRIMAPFWAEAATDSSGGYRFFDLPRGRYGINLGKDGYAAGQVDATIDDPLPRTADVSLYPAARLRVQVTDMAGRPVTGEHVLYAQNLGSGPTAGGNLVSDGSGWIVATMAPGNYDLSVRADGHKPASQRVVIATGENTAYFKLEPASDAAGDTALRGVVRDITTGLGVAGATLRVDGVAPVAVTNEQGEYRFRHPWQTCSLFVQRDGYGTTILRDVAVERGAWRALDIGLKPAAVLEVRLTDRDGNPIEGEVSLGIASLDPGRPFRLGTRVGPAKEGRLTYRQLLPGKYRLTFAVPAGRAIVETVVPAGTSTLQLCIREPG